MCIIIDANLASQVFRYPIPSDFQPIFDWIEKRDGMIVHGGKNSDELMRVESAKRMIIELARQGKARQHNRKQVEDETQRVKKICKSDDPHIIALARVSKVRLLCSADKDLHHDFTTLLKNPKGKIYQNTGHKRLLCHTQGCPGY